MRFVDKVELEVRGGKGGDGFVHFRREKYVPHGGPDGGDGGDGGDVVFACDGSMWTLADLDVRRLLVAEDGGNGGGRKRHGKRGKDLDVRVPPGTVVYEASTRKGMGEVLSPGDRLVVARGGRGGFGNARFVTPTNRAPRFARPGTEGEYARVVVELKMIADVGIVGPPNAGKSTLLAALTGAGPRVGDYPFTTLMPNLGVLGGEGVRVAVCDLPGLIEGASRGKGLGLQFLRHVSRARALLLLLDGARDDLEEQLASLVREMRAFDKALLDRIAVVAVNKCDLRPAPRRVGERSVAAISALRGDGLDALRGALVRSAL